LTGATHNGVFSGNIITDNVATKTALQELETSQVTGLAEVLSLRTLTGTSIGANNLGTFTGSTITDSSTTKSALQQLESAVESVSAGTNRKDGVHATAIVATASTTVNFDSYSKDNVKLDLNGESSVLITPTVNTNRPGRYCIYVFNGAAVTWAAGTWADGDPQPFTGTGVYTAYILELLPNGVWRGVWSG
jgi:hypothetical protein